VNTLKGEAFLDLIMPEGKDIRDELRTEAKEYVCSWAEDCHDDYKGTMKEILGEFSDLNPDEEEWFAWDYFKGDYVTGGGVTINEFERDSRLYDKIECDNMTIKRLV
jgi:hypothetical protein